MQPLLEARDLRRRFGAKAAVDGISITVGPGEVYALVGPDGAGKTTTMRLLCGALRADGGQVTLAGYDLMKQTEAAREHLGYLPQRFSLYGELTVLENLRFFAEVRGVSRKEWHPRSMEILSFVGLDEFVDRRAEALSGGMRQKLGLAAALVHRPRVLLLDEPTGGVDPVTRQAFWQLLIRLLRQGVAVLISTPYMDEAARCNQVGFLSQGRLLMEGSPEMLKQRLQGAILEVNGGPRSLIRELATADGDVLDVQAFGERYHLRVRLQKAPQVAERLWRAILQRGGTVRDMRLIPPTLEDVFISLGEESL
jgi:ABC-2 type transport system ATP-binding protein